MISGIDQYLHEGARALDLRAWRTQILASNIANADTPGYKARDIDFAQALGDALRARGAHQAVTVTRTSERHLGAAGGARELAPLMYRIPFQASIDGNTVETDTELAQFADNAVRYQAGITFMSMRIRDLQSAIRHSV